MYANNANKIQTITIRYMIVSSSWGAFRFSYLMEPVMSTISIGFPISFTSGALTPINMTGTIKTFFILTGFDITASDNTNTIGLTLSASRSSDYLVGTISTLSAKPVSVNYISISALSYN